ASTCGTSFGSGDRSKSKATLSFWKKPSRTHRRVILQTMRWRRFTRGFASVEESEGRFDAGVVFSGAGWRGEAYRCLVAMARRRLKAFSTEGTLQELALLHRD